MKYFASAMVASVISARGTSGGINQGYANPSLGATHGYGYNVGNTYKAGDSHGHYMGHQNGQTSGGYPVPSTGAAYTANDAHDHVYGYDSVQPLTDDDWSEVSTDQVTLRAAIITAIGEAQTAREEKIEEVLLRRKERLSDIHEDNLLKIEAPFDLQLDLLEEEREDIEDAKEHALEDQSDAYSDLQERMTDYQNDREEALYRETDRVIRALERAVDDYKPVEEVLYAMRLDWLQGVYIAGTTAYFDSDVYDLSVFDTEFDIFTFDIGAGKGHGHRTGTMGPGNDREQGFVIGRGGTGDISELNAEPQPIGGKRGRYDRQTQSGHGRPGRPSDYAIGLKAGQREGAYNYDQAADLQVEQSYSKKSSYRKPSYKKPSYKKPSYKKPSYKKPSYKKPAPKYEAPKYEEPKYEAPKYEEPKYEEPKYEKPKYEKPAYKKPSYKKPSYKRPSYKKPSYKPSYKKSSYRKPSYRRPKQSYQKTRQISKRTAYDDYAPIPRGRYYGGYGGAY